MPTSTLRVSVPLVFHRLACHRLACHRLACALALLGALLVLGGCSEKKQADLEATAIRQLPFNDDFTLHAVERLSRSSTPRPRNVVLIIGDGMGFSHLAAARFTTVGPGQQLFIERFPAVGWSYTHSTQRLTTDSAAGATALSTGHKTTSRSVGVDAERKPLESLFERARDRGLQTGVITDTFFIDATPAAFLAHRKERREYESIASDLAISGLKLVIGESRRTIERSAGWSKTLRAFSSAGFSLVRTAEELADAEPGPLLAMFAENSIADADEEPSLPGLVDFAVERLLAAADEAAAGARDKAVPASAIPPASQDVDGTAIDSVADADAPPGFVLVVETEQTDTYSHDPDLPKVVQGISNLNAIASQLVERFSGSDDTLIVVTADHETGGLALLDGKAGEPMEYRWASDYHTAEPVPVFAWGPGSERFVGVHDNTEVGRLLVELLGLETPQAAN